MAGTDRNILKSLMAYTRQLFKNPPTASGFASFGVYDESDLIAVNASGKLPSWPYIFLLDAYMRPKVGILPSVVIEINPIRKLPYELGNREGRTQEAMIHCFGRTRGQRDDLASFVVDYFGSTFPVYSYVSEQGGDIATFVENAEIDPDIIIEAMPRRLTPDERMESSLDLWKIVNMKFRTKH